MRQEGKRRVEEMLVAASGSAAARDQAPVLADFVLAAIDGAFIAHHEDGRVDMHVLLDQLSRAIVALLDTD